MQELAFDGPTVLPAGQCNPHAITKPKGRARTGTGHALKPATQCEPQPSRSGEEDAARGPIAYITRASLHHPALFLLGATLLVFLSGILTLRLFGDIRSSFKELLPGDMPSVHQIEELARRVGGDGSVLVVVQSLDGERGFPEAQGLARRLVDDYFALGTDVIISIEWNMRDTESWYAEHWPLFLSLAKLTEARDALANAVAEQKRKAAPLSLGLEADAVPEPLNVSKELEPWLDDREPLPRAKVEQEFARYRDGMLVSPDGASVTLNVRPTGTTLSVKEASALVERMRAVAEMHRAEMDRDHLRVGFGGSFPLFVAEYWSIIDDVRNTLLLTLGLVLASLFLFFRDVRSTVSLGAAVLTGVAVTFALADILIGHLNSVTAFLGAIVLGNGINYGIIYLARVRQLRRAGLELEAACLGGASAAWRATLLASAATSVSFGVLVVAANRGFRHFGIIGGIGMLSCWAFTFALLPALLVVFERLRPVKPACDAPIHFTVPPWLARVFAREISILSGFGLLTLTAGILFVRALPVAIERNNNNLANELRGQDTLLRDHERAESSLGKSISGAIALLDSPDEAEIFCEGVRQRVGNPRYRAVIQGCDTLRAVLPGEQAAKLEVIHDIARRLSDRVVDALPDAQRARARTVRAELRSQGPLAQAQVPTTLLDRFRERDGSIGRLAVVTARPDAQTEEVPRMAAFVEGVRNVAVGGRTVDATGENVIFSDLQQNIEREGPLTTLLSLLGVCVLVAFFLRSARASAEVVISLVCGVMLMGGIAALMEVRINFLNFIVYPITFGIAVDYGANVVLRAQQRDGRVLQALVEVGPAVILCSWTTIIGYSSLVIASNRALRSFGWYALLGEVACLCTALVMLPAFLLRFGAGTAPGARATAPGGGEAAPESAWPAR
jgi:predicted RND superfamily exporter protein